MIHKIPSNIDSKFRFILIAAERARQLQNGAPPMLDVKSRKVAYIAIKETEQQLVEYELVERDDEE